LQVNHKLVWDWYQSLGKLAEHNRIQLTWVLGYMGIDGNEITDQLVRQDFSHPLPGPEPALDISAKVTVELIRGWTSKKHKEYQQSICGQK
jgi:ribonuclease HI